MTYRLTYLAGLLLTSLPALLNAQTALPNGSFSIPNENARQQILERQQQEVIEQQLDNHVDVRLGDLISISPELAIPSQETPCFAIHNIELVGEQSDRFSWLLTPYISVVEHANLITQNLSEEGEVYSQTIPILGRCLGSVGINAIMRQMQNHLVKRGFVTSRIVAAPQDLSQGGLTLTIVPGTISDIRFLDKRSRANVLPMAPGDLLNLRDIEEALESFERLPSVDADIAITPAAGEGAKPGESDLNIEWSQTRPLRLILSANNAGTRNTGLYQGNISLAYDNPFGLHDLINISLNHDIGGAEGLAGGTESYSVSYTVPWGYNDLTFQWSKSEFFQTAQGAFQQFVFSGESRNASLKLSRLVHRDNSRKINVGVAGWFRSSNNFVNDAEVLIQRRRTGGFELTADYRQFIGRGSVDAQVTYRKGTGAFGSLSAPEEIFDEGTSRPDIVRTNVQLNVPFSVSDHSFQYSGTWRRQLNHDRLTAQDRFSIGGHFTVRGFDGENTLLGDRGWFFRNDLSISLGNSQQSLYVGLDYGEVSAPSDLQLIGTHLAGAALGVRGGYLGVFYDLSFSRPLSQPDEFVSDGFVTYFSINKSF
jgi:hemolysin activation/secretion protein